MSDLRPEVPRPTSGPPAEEPVDIPRPFTEITARDGRPAPEEPDDTRAAYEMTAKGRLEDEVSDPALDDERAGSTVSPVPEHAGTAAVREAVGGPEADASPGDEPAADAGRESADESAADDDGPDIPRPLHDGQENKDTEDQPRSAGGGDDGDDGGRTPPGGGSPGAESDGEDNDREVVPLEELSVAAVTASPETRDMTAAVDLDVNTPGFARELLESVADRANKARLSEPATPAQMEAFDQNVEVLKGTPEAADNSVQLNERIVDEVFVGPRGAVVSVTVNAGTYTGAEIAGEGQVVDQVSQGHIELRIDSPGALATEDAPAGGQFSTLIYTNGTSRRMYASTADQERQAYASARADIAAVVHPKTLEWIDKVRDMTKAPEEQEGGFAIGERSDDSDFWAISAHDLTRSPQPTPDITTQRCDRTTTAYDASGMSVNITDITRANHAYVDRQPAGFATKEVTIDDSTTGTYQYKQYPGSPGPGGRKPESMVVINPEPDERRQLEERGLHTEVQGGWEGQSVAQFGEPLRPNQATLTEFNKLINRITGRPETD